MYILVMSNPRGGRRSAHSRSVDGQSAVAHPRVVRRSATCTACILLRLPACVHASYLVSASWSGVLPAVNVAGQGWARLPVTVTIPKRCRPNAVRPKSGLQFPKSEVKESIRVPSQIRCERPTNHTIADQMTCTKQFNHQGLSMHMQLIGRQTNVRMCHPLFSFTSIHNSRYINERKPD
jgi:hypothetical protein